MVAFSRYVELAYEVAQSKPWYESQMRGPGTAPNHQRFMSELGRVYNELGHAEASESDARAFLEDNVAPP